jgi:hypothetical protein
LKGDTRDRLGRVVGVSRGRTQRALQFALGVQPVLKVVSVFAFQKSVPRHAQVLDGSDEEELFTFYDDVDDEKKSS